MPQNLNAADDIAKVIAVAHVAIAVWMDPSSPLADESGHCMIVIKGEKHLKRAARTGKGGRMVSFRVADMLAAENMRDVYGEGKRRAKGLH
jgi:hypothetical protein